MSEPFWVLARRLLDAAAPRLSGPPAPSVVYDPKAGAGASPDANRADGYAAVKGMAAALVVAGGALLGGCAQSPAYAPAYYQPVPGSYVDLAASAAAMRAYMEQQNAWAWRYQPDDAPLAQAAPLHPAAANNGGAMLSAALPPIAPKPPAAAPAASSDCAGWWRLCHFL